MKLRDLNLVFRGRSWKEFVEKTLANLNAADTAFSQQHNELRRRLEAIEQQVGETTRRHETLRTDHDELRRRVEPIEQQLAALQSEHDVLRARHGDLARIASRLLASGVAGLSNLKFEELNFYYAHRGDQVRILVFDRRLPLAATLAGRSSDEVIDLIASGTVVAIETATWGSDGRLGSWSPLPQLLDDIKREPDFYRLVFPIFNPPTAPKSEVEISRWYRTTLNALSDCPDLIDFAAQAQANVAPNLSLTTSGVPLPFDNRDALPPFALPASPRQRSILFVHNSYYHFNTLAEALKRRGWDAMTVSVEPPDSDQQQFFVGEDLNLFDQDPKERQRKTLQFLRRVPERFEVMHFCGQGQQSLFHENFENGSVRSVLPWDFFELRRHNMTIGYSPSGCLDGARQSSIRKISNGVCARCIWELHPKICNDAKNSAWADLLDRICDWVGLEGDWAVDDRCGPKFVRGPVVFALDPEFWTPELDVEQDKRIAREPGEILVYHAVGNRKLRQAEGRDIKGSAAVERAIAKLHAEGIPIRLFFATDIPITEVRYCKVQADIVVDQLNYGRIGANARESFMMGKPVITRLLPEQPPMQPLRSVAEAPALDATEETVTEVLRALALDPERRKEMSVRSREYALKWFGADACARRFEMVIDRVKAGIPPETDDLYPPKDDQI